MFKLRTGYSFRTAVGKFEKVLDRLEEIGSKYAPITDRASTFGFARWVKAAEKRGLIPVLGVELAVTNSINALKPSVDYFTFIAKDSLSPINRLVEQATTQFRYQPLLTVEQAIEASQYVSVATGNRPMLSMEEPIPGINVLLAPSSPIGLIRKAAANGWPLVASSDNYYPTKSDHGFYEVLCGRNANTQSYDQHIQSEEEWRDSIIGHNLSPEAIAEALQRSAAILGDYSATLEKSSLPVFAADKTLRELCEEGAKRMGCDLTDPVYAARLKRELDLIKEKDYTDYFHIVADIVVWARSKMVVGPARGSSCGSLVCYLLGITAIDPIPFGLIFERFVDINRKDAPDIDIDFSDQQRYMVFDYIRHKYGDKHVARLGTVAMYQPRSALAEVGAALSLPRWKCDAVAESLVERSSGDARALQTLEDTLRTMPAGKKLLEEHPEAEIVMQFEGHPRHTSVHAAGIVISSRPITDFVAVDQRSGATMCDKKDAESEYNLLKIDALGLTQLSVFEDALELAGIQSFDDLYNVPLDDPEAFQVLNDQKWSGIFQFNGQALQSITKMIIVEKFQDMVDITALARPGPLASGGTNQWIKRRNREEPVTYPHPLFEPYLKNTLGIIVYQEQVMEIGRNVGDLSWEEVSELRKAMSKSLGAEYFDQFGNPFKVGAIAKGVDPSVAKKVWDDLCLSGDTVIINPFPTKGTWKKMSLKTLFERGGLGPSENSSAKRVRQSLLMWDGNSLKPYKNWGVIYSGQKMTYTLTTESGNIIHVTEDHRFLQDDGSYKRLKDMKPDIDHVMSDSGAGMPTERKRKKGTGSGGHNWWHKLKDGAPNYKDNVQYLRTTHRRCQHCFSAPYEETHHINMDHEDNRIENLLPVCRKCHKKIHATFSKYPVPWDKGRLIFQDSVVSIVERRIEDVYDVHMPDPYNNFLAEGIVVHNCAYGSWSFNKAHAVAYSLISYWCCWLKAHFPFEFAAATLSHESNPSRQIMLLREMMNEGFDYVPIDPELSGVKWTVGDRDGKRLLIGPLSGIKGIGPKKMMEIIASRARGEPLSKVTTKLLTNPKTAIDSLWPIRDSIHRHLPDPLEMNIISSPTQIIDAQIQQVDQTFMFFCTLDKINPRHENESVLIAKRGYEMKGDNLTYLNLFLRDDTDMIFGKITRFDYDRLGRAIVDKGRPGKSLYAIKGRMRSGGSFRMISISHVKYIGDIEK